METTCAPRSRRPPRLPALCISTCFSPPSHKRGRTEVTQSDVNSFVAPGGLGGGCGLNLIHFSHGSGLQWKEPTGAVSRHKAEDCEVGIVRGHFLTALVAGVGGGGGQMTSQEKV